MGFPLYHIHIIVLNHPYWLIFIHIMHTGLLFGWDSSMALYELVFFNPSDHVLDCGDKVCFLYHL
jgi:photosystem II CP47 chlorophyll apoprotein